MHIKRGNASLTVDVRRSKTALLLYGRFNDLLPVNFRVVLKLLWSAEYCQDGQDGVQCGGKLI